MGHYTRKCRAPRNQDSRNRNQDSSKRTVNIEETSSKAMLAIDGAGFDWSYMADNEVPTNMALMAFLDSKIHNDKTWSQIPDKSKKSLGFVSYNVVPPPPTGLFSPPNLDLSNSGLEEFQQPEFEDYGPKTSKNVSEDTSNEANCNYHQRERVVFGNNYTRVNYNYSAKKAHPSAHRNMVPRAVLMKTGLRSLNTAKLGHPQKEDQGYVDSGCSRHMTGNMSYLQTSRNLMEDMLPLGEEPKEGKLLVNELLKLKNNVLFTDTECLVLSPNFKLPDENQSLLRVTRKNNMYSVDMKNIVPEESLTCLVSKATLDESMLWHRRLGHVNFKNINKLVKDNLVRDLPSKCFENDQTFVACLKGKQHKASCKSKIQNSITHSLFMLHMDLFDLTFVSSLVHKKYCLVITNDYSRFTWVFFLASKDETSGILKSFITEIENLVDKKVKIMRRDNGTEFKIKRNRTLVEAARTMLADSKLPTTFWAEAVNTACYVQNRVLVVKPHNKTPYELFRGRTPSLSFMRPFRCHVTILNTLDYLGKFDGKSDEGFFVGYSLNSKAFRVYNIRIRKVEENLHIRFLEDKPIIAGDRPKWLFDIDVLTKSMNYVPVVAGTNSNDSVGTEDSIGAGHSSKEIGSSQDYILMPMWKDDSLFDSSSKNASNDESQPSSDAKKKDDKGVSKASGIDDQERPKNSTQDVNNVGPSINIASTNVNTVDMSNITTTYPVPSTPNTRIHKDHSLDHVIEDVQSGVQTRRMTKTTNEQGFISAVYEEKTHEDLQNCLFACFLSQVEPKKNKKDERGIMVRNKARLVAQGYTQEEGINYDEVFALVARIEAIRLFLAYASFKDFVVYQMNVKSAFLYGKIEEEVYDAEAKDVDVHLYRSMIGSLMYLTASRPDIMFAVCACARFQVTPKVLHLYVVKRIFRYLKGQPKLGLWYLKDSPFDLEAYTTSDYAGASLDRKSITGGCQFLGIRLISWQCKKQTIIANSTTKAEYVVAASCCGQVLWIQNQMLDYGYNFMNTKIFIDNESTICIVKNPVFRSKTNHIEIRHHFIIDSNEKKLIQMIKIHTD
ncbi:putative ribonuclease H-like domain-containing protein [Tanacetum coccineum]